MLQNRFLWKSPYLFLAIMDVKMACIFLLFSFEFPFNITVLQNITFGVFSDKDKHKQPLDVYRQKMCSWKYSK